MLYIYIRDSTGSHPSQSPVDLHQRGDTASACPQPQGRYGVQPHATRRTHNPPSEAPSTPTRLRRVGPHRPPSVAPSTPTGFPWEKATPCGSMVWYIMGCWPCGNRSSSSILRHHSANNTHAPHVYRSTPQDKKFLISCTSAILRPTCCLLSRPTVSQGLLQSSRPRYADHPCQTQRSFDSQYAQSLDTQTIRSMGLCTSRLHGARDSVDQDHTQLPMAASWTESSSQQRVECYVPNVMLCLTHSTVPCHWWDLGAPYPDAGNTPTPYAGRYLMYFPSP